MLTSYSRLDLNIVVGSENPAHIKTILSNNLLILIDYSSPWDGPPKEVTGSALWRMRAALERRDRLREIPLGGRAVDFVGKFISATDYHFSALVLCLPAGHERNIPATFFRGPDQSDLPL